MRTHHLRTNDPGLEEEGSTSAAVITILSDRREMNKATNPKLRCVDLFAGAGGFSLAAHNAGYDVVAAIEMNANACKTYNANIQPLYPSVEVYDRDILELDPKAFAKEIQGAGGCDVLLGGPPCREKFSGEMAIEVRIFPSSAKLT